MTERARDHRSGGSGRTLGLPRAMRSRIIEHARAVNPRECCGVVTGRGGSAREVIPMTNVASGLDFYRIDDTELFRLYKRLDEQGEEIVAMYHSHPTSPAVPSTTDIELAFWPESIYLICSLAIDDSPDLRGFQIVDGVVTEIPLR